MDLMSSGSGPIRMEDIVYTLNNMVDDISNMYEDPSHSSEDSSVEENDVCVTPVPKSEDATILPSLPSSPTLPVSPVSDVVSEPEDTFSLYSSSPGPSPTSSGFTTPSMSPTSFTFLAGKDDASSDAVQHILDNDAVVASKDVVKTDARLDSCPGLWDPSKQSSWSSLESEDGRSQGVSPILVPVTRSGVSAAEPDSPFAQHPFNLSSNSSSSNGLNSPEPLDLSDSNIIYQTPLHPNSQFINFTRPPTPTLNPVPGICPPHLTMTPPALPPRPTTSVGVRDAPPHLPALHSPTLISAPKLGQNGDWSTTGEPEPEHWANHLVKQREWARQTISYAGSLSEPRSLPPYRPCVSGFKSRSSLDSTSPPRKRVMGAMGRRVYVGPRILPRGEWDPERRGGVLDHWRIRTAHRKERIRVYEDSEARLSLGLKATTAEDEGERAVEASLDSNDTSLLHLLQGGNLDGAEEERKGEDDPDAMRLCVKNGERVPPGLSSPIGDSPRSITGPGEATPDLTTKQPENDDPQAMRWCIKDGVRVSPSPNTRQKTPNQDSAPILLDPPQITVLASQTVFVPEPTRTSGRHAPNTRSPLSRMFMVPSAAVRLRSLVHGSGDASPGAPMERARRKFTSMMF